jgi:hypothetical protein
MLDFTDAGNQPGNTVTAHATYGGNNVSVPNTGTGTPLTWDTLQAGSALLDLSVPTLPTIVTAGAYAVTVVTTPQSSMTDGKAYVFRLSSDTAPGLLVYQTVAIEDSLDFDAHAALTLVYYFTAGSTLDVQVQQADAGAINFPLEVAYVQRFA